jgi:hypothetical protein
MAFLGVSQQGDFKKKQKQSMSKPFAKKNGGENQSVIFFLRFCIAFFFCRFCAWRAQNQT